jgi:hypothetical protein
MLKRDYQIDWYYEEIPPIPKVFPSRINQGCRELPKLVYQLLLYNLFSFIQYCKKLLFAPNKFSILQRTNYPVAVLMIIKSKK